MHPAEVIDRVSKFTRDIEESLKDLKTKYSHPKDDQSELSYAAKGPGL